MILSQNVGRFDGHVNLSEWKTLLGSYLCIDHGDRAAGIPLLVGLESGFPRPRPTPADASSMPSPEEPCLL